MPDSLADYYLTGGGRRGPLLAKDDTHTIKIVPDENEILANEKTIDTGDNYFQVHLSTGVKLNEEGLKLAIDAAFKKVGLNPTGTKFLYDSGGHSRNALRVPFTYNTTFQLEDVTKLRYIHFRGGGVGYSHSSPSVAIALGICDRCIQFTDNKKHLSIRCTCGDNKSGPSSSAANRKAAKDAFQSRALKRTREIEDPFA